MTAVWAGDAVALPGLASLAPFGLGERRGARGHGARRRAAARGAAGVPAGPLRVQPALPTWDCGYAAEPAGSPRLQYTGSSFAEIVTSRFAWVLRPHETLPRIDGHFPAPSAFHSHVDDTVLERLVQPAGRLSHALSAWFRVAAAGTAPALRRLHRGGPRPAPGLGRGRRRGRAMRAPGASVLRGRRHGADPADRRRLPARRERRSRSPAAPGARSGDRAIATLATLLGASAGILGCAAALGGGHRRPPSLSLPAPEDSG